MIHDPIFVLHRQRAAPPGKSISEQAKNKLFKTYGLLNLNLHMALLPVRQLSESLDQKVKFGI